QYYGQYPIIDPYGQSFGKIRVVMNNGIINLYERSIASLVTTGAEREEDFLPGGELLLTTVQNHANLATLKRLYPAYRPSLQETHVVLKPVWIAEHVDGVKEFLF